MRNFPELELGVIAKTFPSRSERDAGGESTARGCPGQHGERLYPLSRDQTGLQTARARSAVRVRASDNGKAHMVARNTHQA
jgi:hypothetical protein